MKRALALIVVSICALAWVGHTASASDDDDCHYQEGKYHQCHPTTTSSEPSTTSVDDSSTTSTPQSSVPSTEEPTTTAVPDTTPPSTPATTSTVAASSTTTSSVATTLVGRGTTIPLDDDLGVCLYNSQAYTVYTVVGSYDGAGTTEFGFLPCVPVTTPPQLPTTGTSTLLAAMVAGVMSILGGAALVLARRRVR